MATFNQKPYRSKEQYNPNFEPPVMAEREPQKKTTPLPSIGEFNQRGANALWANTMQQTPATQERARLHLGGTQMQPGPRIPYNEDRSQPVPMAEATITGEFEEPKDGSGVPALGPVGYQRTQERPVALPEYQRYNVEPEPRQKYMPLQEAIRMLYQGKNLGALKPEHFNVFNGYVNALMAESARDVNRADRLWKERQGALGQSAEINNRGLKTVHDIQQGGQREDTLRRNLEMQEQMAPYEMQEKQARAQSALGEIALREQAMKEGVSAADMLGKKTAQQDQLMKLYEKAASKDITPEEREWISQMIGILERGGIPSFQKIQEAQPERGKWNPFVANQEAQNEKYGYVMSGRRPALPTR